MIEIASDRLTARINPLGAELSSLRDADGRELMTDADPAYWTGRAPILFPIIGLLSGGVWRMDGREYALPKHGFARHMAFEVIETAADRATLRLTARPETLQGYPWRFRLDIGFAVAGATLSIEARVANCDDSAMPASFGFHPAFAWPLPYGRPRAEHRVTFDAGEPEALLALTPDGLIAPGRRESPLDGRVLHLADALFEDDALIWDPVHSQRVRYGAGDGPQLVIDFPDTPRLGIWTKPGAHFVCIEPWHGLADPAGFIGEIWEKPGIMRVAPGEARAFRMSISLTK